MSKQFLRTNNAPAPVGPYSQGIKVGNFVFVSGQGPFDPKTGKIVGNDIKSQTRQTLENIKGIVEASGFAISDVVMVSVFLKAPEHFDGMNEVYKTFFPDKPPTRTTVAAGFVALGMLIEANAMAYRE
jgi:2-iminobutanoate/2-iminopropanoate deaminase